MIQTAQIKTSVGRWPLALILITGGSFLLFQSSFSRAQCPPAVQWKQIGPAPLIINPPDSADGQGPDAGMVRDIAIDPRGSSDLTIYIATDNGGIWKTTDGGNNWTPKTELMRSLNIGSVALDPANPSIVYAGTGNEANQGFFKGAGVYKSSDGGDTWATLGTNIFADVAINRIVLPAPNVLLIASGNGVYESDDGGANFTFILGGNATDLDVDTGSASTVYASIAGLGVFKLNSSGAGYSSSGNTFTASNGGPASPGYIAFAQSTLPNNQTMYINVQLLSGPVQAGMYKSVNGGTSWSPVTVLNNDVEYCDGECGYAQTIGVDPQDASRVYIGVRTLSMSTDGGSTGLSTANRIDLNRVHADQHALVFSPPSHVPGGSYQTGRRTLVYNGTDGGLARTADATPSSGTWTILNGFAACSTANGSLATVLLRQIDMGRGSTADNVYTYGVAQDLGVSSHSPACVGTPWHLGQGGDGWAVAVDPLNAKHALAFNGCCITTTVDGDSWGASPTGFPATPRWLYFDPSGGKAYAIGNVGYDTYLYRSTDNGGSFSVMHSFAPRLSLNGIAINIVKANPQEIWVGLSDGTVTYTTDANLGVGAHWSTAIQVTGAPSQGVSGIAIDPSNTSQVVLVYPSGQAFMTTDSGANWANISGNLPNLPLRAVVTDPNTTPHTIIVASDGGVMATANFGGTWQALGAGLPTVQCTALAIDPSAIPSLLRVGTYGRSAFELAYDRNYVDWRSLAVANGTRENPFRTVTQALNAAASGDTKVIIIQSGDYPEPPPPLVINQCCTLMAINGQATIH